MAKLALLDSVLFGIFTDDDYSKFRWPEHIWAVTEALNRVRLSTKPLIDWNVRKARKEHKCSHRGCLIKPEEKYYLSPNGKKTKVCVRCEARLWRDSQSWLYWRMRNANKDHRCARGGCTIKTREEYFIWDGGNTDGIKICGRCMALVLYFKDPQKLKPYLYLGWDYQHCGPKLVEKPLLLAGMHANYFFPEAAEGKGETRPSG